MNLTDSERPELHLAFAVFILKNNGLNLADCASPTKSPGPAGLVDSAKQNDLALTNDAQMALLRSRRGDEALKTLMVRLVFALCCKNENINGTAHFTSAIREIKRLNRIFVRVCHLC